MEQTKTPKVSVITCFLNVGSLIEDAIKSVFNQTYDNWELWLIDDGSTDCSTQIAQKYAADYADRIFYREHQDHQNRGQGASRNVGIRQAEGKYIAILDADDVWLPEFLTAQVEIMENYPVAMVCQASRYWYSWKNPAQEDVMVKVGAQQDCVHLPPQLMIHLYPLGEGTSPSPCGILLRKDVLMKNGAFEDSFRGMFDDQILFVKHYLHEPVYISSRCDNLYRQRPGSLVSSAYENGRYRYEKKIFFQWLKGYLDKMEPAHSEIREMYRSRILELRKESFWEALKFIPRQGKKIINKILK